MAPREWRLPGTRPTAEGMKTVDEHTISPAGDPFYAASCPDDDTIEAHYASLERDVSCYCYGSGVVVLTIEEDGQEHDEAVPCKRCRQA